MTLSQARVMLREGETDTMTRKFGELRRWALATGLAIAALAAYGLPVHADTFGQPSPWEINFQPAASPIMETIHGFHFFVLVIITTIVIFVMTLLAICILRFNERANPKPSQSTHNTTLEIIWTVIPVFILVAMAIPSFRLLHDQLDLPKADVTVKAIGTAQWTWTYSYPDHGGFSFDSNMLQDNERKPGQPRLLAVDNEMVLPVNKIIRVQTTAEGIIHSFTVPAFGIKIDAIPGRLNETWFKATREGMFYGQCSELCGRNHAYMPIAVRIVSEDKFKAWVEEAKKKYAETPARPSVVAEVAAR